MIVVAISIVLTAISLPTVASMMTTAQLRSIMGDLSSLYQNGRSLAVRQNKITRLRYQLNNGRWVAYVDDGVSPAGLTASAPQLSFPAPVSQVSAPTGASGQPTVLTDAACGANSLNTIDSTNDTYFNRMGLPCEYSSGSCPGGQAYAYYFNYSGSLGGTSWSALCVSPAGRMKGWYWTGSSWTN